MSFSKDLKEEIALVIPTDSEMLAEMLAFLHLNSSLEKDGDKQIIVFETKTEVAADRFSKILKHLYNAQTKIERTNENKIKTTSYIKISIISKTQEIISEHGLIDRLSDEKDFLTETKENKKAYLRAAFLSRGSVNSPMNAEYHLEIFAKEKDNIIFIQRLMNTFFLNAKIIKRRNGYIAYLKEAEKISDFLKLTGSYKQLFQYEEQRIERDLTNSINRVINCEVANEKKTSKNYFKIINAINYLEKIKASVLEEEKIKEVVNIIKERGSSSLLEISEYYFERYKKKISKSGINHRIAKILYAYEILKDKK